MTVYAKPGVYNLFAIASRIAFIYMKYGHQWVRVIFMRYCLVPTNVANCSYNEYTKSSLKIYQIYTKFISVTKFSLFIVIFSMPFDCFTWMIHSCCWAVPSYRWCKLNFYFLNFSSDRFSTNGKFNLTTSGVAKGGRSAPGGTFMGAALWAIM